MTDEQINAAIAEVCGWQILDEPIMIGCACYAKDPHGEPECGVPNYCTDLNAMHQAEGALSDGDLWTMKYNLPLQGDLEFRSTARQRAEAFLRTLDKWKSEN